MRFAVSRQLVGDQAWVLRVEGEIDISTADLLRAHLRDTMAADPQLPVVCDLEGVGLLDSVGISVLVAVCEQASVDGRAFCVAAPRGQVRRTLELVRLVELLPCFTEVAEALDAGADTWTSTASSR